MLDDLEDYEGVIVHEPLLCCGGVKSAWTPFTPLDGYRVCLIAIQHELWCCKAQIPEA